LLAFSSLLHPIDLIKQMSKVIKQINQIVTRGTKSFKKGSRIPV